ncbi:MAG: RnfABCDGE type electron transport complex subunit G [Clostridium sp.]
MKDNFKLGAILLVITSVAGLLLGFANDLTKEAIIENSKLNKDDLAYIMPEATAVQDSSLEINEVVTEIYEAVNGSNQIGYVFKVTTKGFHGPVDVVVAISNEDKVTGIKILTHSETPGLGARIEEEGFLSKFKNLETKEDLTIVKTSPTKESEVEGISGASVSSKAVGTAVNDAVRYYKENVKGEELAPQEEQDSTSGASEW